MREASIEALARRQAVWDVACAAELALPVGVPADDRLIALAITIRAHGPAARHAICGAPVWTPPEREA